MAIEEALRTRILTSEFWQSERLLVKAPWKASSLYIPSLFACVGAALSNQSLHLDLVRGHLLADGASAPAVGSPFVFAVTTRSPLDRLVAAYLDVFRRHLDSSNTSSWKWRSWVHETGWGQLPLSPERDLDRFAAFVEEWSCAYYPFSRADTWGRHAAWGHLASQSMFFARRMANASDSGSTKTDAPGSGRSKWSGLHSATHVIRLDRNVTQQALEALRAWLALAPPTASSFVPPDASAAAELETAVRTCHSTLERRDAISHRGGFPSAVEARQRAGANASALVASLLRNETLLLAVCSALFQDAVCLGYPLPAECTRWECFEFDGERQKA